MYQVIIDTPCRACAMALAGHAPLLGNVRGIQAIEKDDVGKYVEHIYACTTMIRAHDGTPFRCREHGVAMDLREEPVDPRGR